jgi:hypothetical protein
MVCLAGIGCGDDSGGPAIDAAPPDAPITGTITFGWTIMRSGAPATCAEVGNPTVRITALPESGGVAEIDTFSCTSMTASTAVPPGMYTVTFNLGELAETQPMRDVTVLANQDTAVGTVTFNVTAEATIQFHLVTSASGGNCADETTAGAGITAFVLELRDASGMTCVPTTFNVGMPAETYASDCAGAQFRCIESDEVVQVTGLVFGNYRVLIQGFEDTTICYPYEAVLSASTSTTVADVPLALIDPAPDGAAALCANP